MKNALIALLLMTGLAYPQVPTRGGGTGELPPAIACPGGAGTSGTVPISAPPLRVFVYLPFQTGQEITFCFDNTQQTIVHFGAAGIVDEYGPVITSEIPDVTTGGTIIVITPHHRGESQSQHWWRHKIAIGQSAQAVMPVSGLLNGPPSHTIPVSGEPLLVATWTSEGVTHQVQTPSKPGEDPSETWKRHTRWVQAGYEFFPPDTVKK